MTEQTGPYAHLANPVDLGLPNSGSATPAEVTTVPEDEGVIASLGADPVPVDESVLVGGTNLTTAHANSPEAVTTLEDDDEQVLTGLTVTAVAVDNSVLDAGGGASTSSPVPETASGVRRESLAKRAWGGFKRIFGKKPADQSAAPESPGLPDDEEEPLEGLTATAVAVDNSVLTPPVAASAPAGITPPSGATPAPTGSSESYGGRGFAWQASQMVGETREAQRARQARERAGVAPATPAGPSTTPETTAIVDTTSDKIKKRVNWQAMALFGAGAVGRILGKTAAKSALASLGIAGAPVAVGLGVGMASAEAALRTHKKSKELIAKGVDEKFALNQALLLANTRAKRDNPEWGKIHRGLEKLGWLLDLPANTLITMASGIRKDRNEVAKLFAVGSSTLDEPTFQQWLRDSSAGDVKKLARRFTRLRAMAYGDIERAVADSPEIQAPLIKALHQRIDDLVRDLRSSADVAMLSKLDAWKEHGGIAADERKYHAELVQRHAMIAGLVAGKALTLGVGMLAGQGLLSATSLLSGDFVDQTREAVQNVASSFDRDQASGVGATVRATVDSSTTGGTPLPQEMIQPSPGATPSPADILGDGSGAPSSSDLSVNQADVDRWQAYADHYTQTTTPTPQVPAVGVQIDSEALQTWVTSDPTLQEQREALVTALEQVQAELMDPATQTIDPEVTQDLIAQWGLEPDAFAPDKLEDTMTNIATVLEHNPDAASLQDITATEWTQTLQDSNIFDTAGNPVVDIDQDAINVTQVEVADATDVTSQTDQVVERLDAESLAQLTERMEDFGYSGDIDTVHVVGSTEKPEWLESIANMYHDEFGVNQSGLMLDGTVDPNNANVFDMIFASGPDAFEDPEAWEVFTKEFESTFTNGAEPGKYFVSYQDMIDHPNVKDAYDDLQLKLGAKLVIPDIGVRELAPGTYAAVQNLPRSGG